MVDESRKSGSSDNESSRSDVGQNLENNYTWLSYELTPQKYAHLRSVLYMGPVSLGDIEVSVGVIPYMRLQGNIKKGEFPTLREALLLYAEGFSSEPSFIIDGLEKPRVGGEYCINPLPHISNEEGSIRYSIVTLNDWLQQVRDSKQLFYDAKVSTLLRMHNSLLNYAHRNFVGYGLLPSKVLEADDLAVVTSLDGTYNRVIPADPVSSLRAISDEDLIDSKWFSLVTSQEAVLDTWFEGNSGFNTKIKRTY